MLLYLAGQQAGVVEVVISPLINNFVLCCFFVPVTMTQVTTPPPPPLCHPRLHWGKWNGLIEGSYGVSWLLWRLSAQSPSPSRLRAWETGVTDHPTPSQPSHQLSHHHLTQIRWQAVQREFIVGCFYGRSQISTRNCLYQNFKCFASALTVLNFSWEQARWRKWKRIDFL